MENDNFGIPAAQDDEYREIAWGMPKQGEKFSPMWINRHNPSDHDVKFDVLYCGICHSDSFMGENPIGQTVFPFIPGHEFLGVVTEIGSKVTKVKDDGELEVEIATGVKVRVVKSTVAQVLSKTEPATD